MSNREVLVAFKAEWNKLSLKQLSIKDPRPYENDVRYIWDGANHANHIIAWDTRDTDFILFANKWIFKLATTLFETVKELEEAGTKIGELTKNIEHYRNSSDTYLKELTKLRKIAEELMDASPNDMFALEAAQLKIRALTTE